MSETDKEGERDTNPVCVEIFDFILDMWLKVWLQGHNSHNIDWRQLNSLILKHILKT